MAGMPAPRGMAILLGAKSAKPDPAPGEIDAAHTAGTDAMSAFKDALDAGDMGAAFEAFRDLLSAADSMGAESKEPGE